MINRYTKVLAASPFLRAPPKSRSPQVVPAWNATPKGFSMHSLPAAADSMAR
jgi:hypothetical protein